MTSAAAAAALQQDDTRTLQGDDGWSASGVLSPLQSPVDDSPHPWSQAGELVSPGSLEFDSSHLLLLDLPPSPFSAVDWSYEADTERTHSTPSSSDAAVSATATPLHERDSSRVVRRSHKSTDARRRRREAAVIDHLGRLSCPTPCDDVDRLPPPSHPQGRASRTARTSQRDRLAILEASAHRIEQLEALVQRLAQQPTSVVAPTAVTVSSAAAASSSYTILPHPQSAATPTTAAPASSSSSSLSPSSPQCMELLSHASSHNSLYSSLVLHSRLALVLLDVDSGMILDVSSPFLTLCGWPRPALVNVPMSPPLYFDSRLRRYGAQFTARDAAAFLPHRYRPLMRAITSNNNNEDVEADQAEQPHRLVPLVGCKQYPAVLHDLQQWIEGRVASFKGPIRKRWADGRLYELDTAVWSVETREVRGADGSRRQVPTRAVLISGIDDSIQVDEL